MTKPRAVVSFGRSEIDNKLVGDDTDAHIMTIAPTGAGKGATSIIPNLLTWPGSVFVIDPKGENAARTITQRMKLNNGKVYLLDPFSIVKDPPPPAKFIRASYNPLEFIDDGDAGITQADRLADALILKEKGENHYFTNEARALLKALILHIKTDRLYEKNRTLGKLNEIASDPERLIGGRKYGGGGKHDDVAAELNLGEMQLNSAYGGLIARTAARMASKGDREGPAVWSTLQSNLSQFLDDPRLARNLRGNSFDFLDLTRDNISVFAVLPAQYLETFSRWLRLLVGSALDRLYEGMTDDIKPDIPALMVLDEFAHLGNLEAIKTAYGLARGAGLKIWAILQSLSQLDDIYGQYGRENLIANSGAIEIFNMVDNLGCEYFSTKIGQNYRKIISTSESVTTSTKSALQRGSAGEEGASINKTVSESADLRPRMLPLEIVNLHPDKKIVFRRQHDFEILLKTPYWDHPVLKKLANLPPTV